jgi:uncharacterized protein (TIGR02453 family)
MAASQEMTAMTEPYFSGETFQFLSSLAANNNREWFGENKPRYEDTVCSPALRFIDDIAVELAAISPHFLAIPKKVGGSLMRIYRDTRFSKDKRPYKSNIGIHFRHEVGKDVHAPGFYLHIAPGECFVGVGIWRPDSTALGKIRDAIVEDADSWHAARDDKVFNKRFRLSGDRLTNPPRGYAGDHPLIEDLKWKDFIAVAELDQREVTGNKLLSRVVDDFAAADPFMRFLCKALEVRY